VSKEDVKIPKYLGKMFRTRQKKIFTKFIPEMEIKFARKVSRKNIGRQVTMKEELSVKEINKSDRK
jgi:hypothetical protein